MQTKSQTTDYLERSFKETVLLHHKTVTSIMESSLSPVQKQPLLQLIFLASSIVLTRLRSKHLIQTSLDAASKQVKRQQKGILRSLTIALQQTVTDCRRSKIKATVILSYLREYMEIEEGLPFIVKGPIVFSLLKAPADKSNGRVNFVTDALAKVDRTIKISLLEY